MGPQPQPGILDITLYKGGDSHVEGANRPTKLSSNENPFGPSPRAKAAYATAGETLELYPSTDHAGLRAAIAETHGLDPERIICGAGSDEIIAFLCNCYAGPGDEVLYPEHGFLMYAISARAAGATPVNTSERDRVVDVDAMLAAVTERTRIVFLANPANPTGTLVDGAEISRLADGLPEDVLLVLDGAYAEYVAAEDYDAGMALATMRPNVFMTRTFSKIYGLGGLRIGWGYGQQDIIDVLNRVRGPFNLSEPALVTAEAAMRDQAYVARCKEANAEWLAWLASELAAIGIPSDQSHANFLLARFADEAEAQAADAFLRKAGIIVRHVTSYGLPNCLRITIGDEVACRSVATRLQEFKASV